VALWHQYRLYLSTCTTTVCACTTPSTACACRVQVQCVTQACTTCACTCSTTCTKSCASSSCSCTTSTTACTAVGEVASVVEGLPVINIIPSLSPKLHLATQLQQSSKIALKKSSGLYKQSFFPLFRSNGEKFALGSSAINTKTNTNKNAL